jgi:hypothetical protein
MSKILMEENKRYNLKGVSMFQITFWSLITAAIGYFGIHFIILIFRILTGTIK